MLTVSLKVKLNRKNAFKFLFSWTNFWQSVEEFEQMLDLPQLY